MSYSASGTDERLDDMSKTTQNRISRPQLIATVADSLPLRYLDDLPAIRQAINDTADSFRRDGYSCRDFDQDAMVRAVQKQMLVRY
jgi:hypothetical protein